jgi:hypothetical protein
MISGMKSVARGRWRTTRSMHKAIDQRRRDENNMRYPSRTMAEKGWPDVGTVCKLLVGDAWYDGFIYKHVGELWVVFSYTGKGNKHLGVTLDADFDLDCIMIPDEQAAIAGAADDETVERAASAGADDTTVAYDEQTAAADADDTTVAYDEQSDADDTTVAYDEQSDADDTTVAYDEQSDADDTTVACDEQSDADDVTVACDEDDETVACDEVV